VPAAIPDPPWTTEKGPESVTGWTLVQAGTAMAKTFTAAMATIGLTPTQFGVLAHLVHEPGISQADLARQVLVTPQSMGELLVSLERLGYVSRTGAQRRGRPIAVAITDAGLAVLDRAAPIVLELNRPAALGLSAAESVRLNDLLHRVHRAVGGGR
jgi:DNA-binding MarR family transcriptional regulator